MANYFLPGYAGELTGDSSRVYDQKSPLYHLYSPRLFGAPPQFTHQCDMRLKSALNNSNKLTPGPVGDWYLDNILRDAQVANFIIGHAQFNGGMHSLATVIKTCGIYYTALKRYKVFGSETNKDTEITNQQTINDIVYNEYTLDQYNEAYEELMTYDDGQIAGMIENEDGTYSLDVEQIAEASGIVASIDSMFGGLGVLKAPLKAGLSMQQAFYSFVSDWNSYINNVKMMLNTAIIMLGLTEAKVRIGDSFVPIATQANDQGNTDVWTEYRFITSTADTKVGEVNAIDTLLGDTNQYVSFMIEPVNIQESYTNNTGESQIYANVIHSGEGLGNEIAFITNTSRNGVDDALLNLSGDAVNLAERVMSSLTLGTGRFTAAILGSMARSYTGDHTIFPKIFTSHTSTQSVTLNIKLRASAGDPYSYFIEILVPLFHLMGMAIPQMSKNAASAYSYPPLVQVNIPGIWGTKLGIIQSLSISKLGNDLSVNGYPLAVDISVVIEDLQHVIMSSPMNNTSQMLNNDTMFDYIAQCAGVDKYRANPSIRIVTKLMLAAVSGKNFLHNLGTAILNDGTSFVNKLTGVRNIIS